MKNFIALTLQTLFCIILLSCSSGKSDKREITEELVEANAYLQKSLDLREEMMEMEKQLKNAEIDYAYIKDQLKIWDKDIIEVPGFEHSHDDEHQREYHVHNAMKPFSDQEHLDYQLMMHEEISQLYELMKRKLVEEIMDATED